MQTIKHLAITLILFTGLSANAALYSSDLDVLIPDNSALGTADALKFVVSGEGDFLSALTLTFTLQGGNAADLSGYLRLGNTGTSPSYDLTSMVKGQSLASGDLVNYSLNFATPTFSSTFAGQNPNNTWTLFFADNRGLDATTLTGWSLDITAVPEPVNVALAVFGVGAVGVGFVRRKMRSEPGQRNRE